MKLTRQTSVLLCASITSFFTSFMASSLNVALKIIGDGFSMSAVMIGWVTTSFMLATAAFLLPMGRISDIHGRKKLFMIGISLFIVSSFGAGVSQGQWMFLLFRVLQGAGSACVIATSSALITSEFPSERRGWALGISVACVYAGLSTGPVIGGFLAASLGWRSLFWFTIAGLVVSLVVGMTGIHGEKGHAKGEPFDFTGTVLYMLFLILFISGFSDVVNVSGVIMVCGGLAAGILFFAHQISSKHPLICLKCFAGNRVFIFSNVSAMINYCATAAIAFLLSLYLQYSRGFSPDTAGLVLLWQPAFQSLLSPAMGRLSDTVEPRILASSGMGLIALSLLLLSMLSMTTPLPWIIIVLVFLGIGFALFSSPNTNAVMGSVEHRFLGTASSVLGTMRVVGQVLSMGISLLLFRIFLGDRNPAAAPSSFLHSMKWGFAIFAILCAAGIATSLSRGNSHGKGTKRRAGASK